MLEVPENISTDGYNPVKDAYDQLFKRYNSIAQNAENLSKEHSSKIMMMGIHCIGHHEMPIDKVSRWLGFVQGILYANNLIDIKAERDITRPLIHEAYVTMGKNPPESIDLDQMIKDSWD